MKSLVEEYMVSTREPVGSRNWFGKRQINRSRRMRVPRGGPR